MERSKFDVTAKVVQSLPIITPLRCLYYDIKNWFFNWSLFADSENMRLEQERRSYNG